MREIKSDKVTEYLNHKIRGTAGYVIFFGGFVIFCMLMQTADSILDFYMIDNTSNYFNKNFNIPINTLTSLYAALCCVYIGVDRSTSILATIKGEKNITNYGNPERNRHIIIQNFFICMIAIILNRFIDANLGLEPLLVSFGGSIILYVSGQKGVYQASKFAPIKDNNNNNIDDRIENNEELIDFLNKAAKESKSIEIKYNDNNKIFILGNCDGSIKSN